MHTINTTDESIQALEEEVRRQTKHYCRKTFGTVVSEKFFKEKGFEVTAKVLSGGLISVFLNVKFPADKTETKVTKTKKIQVTHYYPSLGNTLRAFINKLGIKVPLKVYRDWIEVPVEITEITYILGVPNGSDKTKI